MPPTLEFVNDYLRFVIGFFEVISISAPHIYRSALPLSPQESIIRKLYKSYVQPLPRVVRGLPISWEPIVATALHRDSVLAATWSPCSKFIAVYLGTKIEIMDAVTLERLHTLTHPSRGGNRWLTFSPDSRSLTLFSDDHGLITWDLQTGGRISTIPSPSNRPSPLLPSVYSMDRKTAAVACRGWDETITTFTDMISTYDLLSGTHVYSHPVSEGQIVASIWTHGELLRFATVEPRFITIWEVGFTLEHTLTQIESLPAPDKISSDKCIFLPTRTRLAFTLGETVLVWDARDSKFLLNFVVDDWPTGLSFSSDGRFFACGTFGREIPLWKESPTGYVLHRKLTFSIDTELMEITTPLFSPNGESIITTSSHSGTRLWRTTDPIASLPIVPTQPAKRTDFTLQFSPDRSLAAAARFGENTATIIDLKSGNLRLIIDTAVKICGLGANANAVTVVGDGKIITWDLPAGDCVLDARANIHDSIRTIFFDCPAPPPESLHYVSISPDFNHFVITYGRNDGLDLYDVSTGKHLVGTTSVNGYMPWFTRDGREVWSSRGEPRYGQKIMKGRKFDVIGLESLEWNVGPSGGYPWESPHGHDFTDDGWILDSRKKRVMWLPHHWRLHMWYRIWGGRFLGLLYPELPEPVIIELDE